MKHHNTTKPCTTKHHTTKHCAMAVILSVIFFGAGINIAYANPCPNPPKLKTKIAKLYQEVEFKACNEPANFWRVKKGNKMSLITQQGKVIIPFKYNYIGKYKSNLDYLTVAVNDKNGKFLDAKWGIIDKKGKEIIKPTYEYIYPISNHLFAIEIYDKKLYSDNENQQYGMFFDHTKIEDSDAIFLMLDMLKLLASQSMSKEHKAKIGIIDTQNQLLLPAEYDYIADIDDNFITIYKDGKGMMIDKAGEILKGL